MRLPLASLLCVALLLGVVPPHARAAAPRYPATSSATVGGVQVVSESDSDALLSGVQIFVAGGLERQTTATNGAAALTAECIMRTPVKTGDMKAASLREAISTLGGSVDYTIDDSSVHYYLETRPEKMPEMLGLLAKALAQPDISPDAIGAARDVLKQRVADADRNPLRVGVQMFKESYLQGGAAYPEYGTAASLGLLGASAVRNFHAATYVRGGVFASTVGKPTPEITAALGALAQALPAGSLPPLNVKARTLPESATRIIAQRDVGRPFVVVGFGAPSPGSHDFGAMLLLESLLSTAFEHESATTVSAAQRSVGAFYLYDSVPASLVVYVNGGTGVDPSLALREILVVAKALSSKPLGADALRRFKTTTEGSFVTNAISLSDRSFLIGTFATGGLASQSINGALEAIEHATSADVQRVAKNYLQRYVVALVLPRQQTQQR